MTPESNSAIALVVPKDANEKPFIPGPGRHLTALDGLRGLAALLVLIFHIFQIETEPSSGVARLAYKATRVGQTGVDLFFVLSGFLITGILQDTKGSARYFKNFYGRRTIRIFPLYYAVLIVATLIIPWIIGRPITDADPLKLWTFTANLAGTIGFAPKTFIHFWTLAVEEQFYLIWPAVVYAFARPALMKVCVGCVIGSIFVRIGFLSMGFSADFFMPGRLDSLALGGLLALAARSPEGVSGWRTKAVITLIGMAVFVGPLYIFKTGSHEAWLQVVKYSLLAVLYASILALAVDSSPTSIIGRFFNTPILRWFGKYSYGVYMFHPFWIDMYVVFKKNDVSGAFETPFWVGFRAVSTIGLSAASAWLSWHILESRFMKLKHHFEYQTPPTESVVRDDVDSVPNAAPAGVPV